MPSVIKIKDMIYSTAYSKIRNAVVIMVLVFQSPLNSRIELHQNSKNTHNNLGNGRVKPAVRYSWNDKLKKKSVKKYFVNLIFSILLKKELLKFINEISSKTKRNNVKKYSITFVLSMQ